MGHHAPPVVIDGPRHPRAFEGIPIATRRGQLDTTCPECEGRGQWNTEIHAHFRSKRQPCHLCLGEGWLETSGDATAVPDIIVVNGHAQWITRWVPFENGSFNPLERSLIKQVDASPVCASSGAKGEGNGTDG